MSLLYVPSFDINLLSYRRKLSDSDAPGSDASGKDCSQFQQDAAFNCERQSPRADRSLQQIQNRHFLERRIFW